MDIQIPTRENEFAERVPTPPPPSKAPWVVAVLALLAAGGAGYFAFKSMGDADHAAAELKDSQKKLSDEKARADGLQTEVSALRGEKKSLEAEVEKKQAELARLKATYDSLNDKMQAEIQKGDIKLTESGGRIQVDLVDKILFDSGQAELSPRGQEVLMRIGSVLAKIDDRQLQVSGHTDDSPPTDKIKAFFPTNWELSTARAVNVVRFLSEKAAVPQKRLTAAGYGQFQPVATNANPEGRARNRRIEILLTPVIEGKAGAVHKEVAAVKKANKK